MEIKEVTEQWIREAEERAKVANVGCRDCLNNGACDCMRNCVTRMTAIKAYIIGATEQYTYDQRRMQNDYCLKCSSVSRDGGQ